MITTIRNGLLLTFKIYIYIYIAQRKENIVLWRHQGSETTMEQHTR